MTQAELKEEMKNAMRAKDQVALMAIRNVLALIMEKAVELGRGPQGELTDEEITGLMRSQAKKIKDGINQFVSGGNEELAQEYREELAVLEKYLPALMSQDAIRPIVEAKAAEMGIADKSKAGQLIGAVSRDLAGQADGADIKAVVDTMFE